MKYVVHTLTVVLFYSTIGIAMWISKNPWWCLMTLFTPNMVVEDKNDLTK